MIRITFQPRDLWIGIYIERPHWMRIRYKEMLIKYQIFICLIPMFPIEISWTRKPKWLKEHLEDEL